MASSATNSSFIGASIRRSVASAIAASSSSAKSSKRNRVRECDYCGEKIRIVGGWPLNHPNGALHRCGRPVNYRIEMVMDMKMGVV